MMPEYKWRCTRCGMEESTVGKKKESCPVCKKPVENIQTYPKLLFTLDDDPLSSILEEISRAGLVWPIVFKWKCPTCEREGNSLTFDVEKCQYCGELIFPEATRIEPSTKPSFEKKY